MILVLEFKALQRKKRGQPRTIACGWGDAVFLINYCGGWSEVTTRTRYLIITYFSATLI